LLIAISSFPGGWRDVQRQSNSLAAKRHENYHDRSVKITESGITPILRRTDNRREEKTFIDVGKIDPMLGDIRQPFRLIPDDCQLIL
jgi:hypothetical protein